MNEMINEAMPVLANWGMKIVTAIIGLVVGLMVAGWVRNLVERSMRKAKVDETVTRFAGTIVRWCVFAAFAIGVIGVFDVQTASFAALLASAGLAIGLAFQGTLSNLAAGVMLVVFRPFKVGDVVRAAGETGKIEAIDLMTTMMDTPDNRRIIIPNSAVFSGTIENITFHPERRVTLDVGCDYGADLDKTREVLERVAQSIPNQVRDSAVVLTGLGDSSVNWSVRVWVKTEDFWGTLEKITNDAKKELDGAEIGIPFPQMDVHFPDGPAKAA